MQFRWAVFISLWTLLAGPAFDSSGPSGFQRRKQPSIAASPAKKEERRALFRMPAAREQKTKGAVLFSAGPDDQQK
jgi:hypothetical protein